MSKTSRERDPKFQRFLKLAHSAFDEQSAADQYFNHILDKCRIHDQPITAECYFHLIIVYDAVQDLAHDIAIRLAHLLRNLDCVIDSITATDIHPLADPPDNRLDETAYVIEFTPPADIPTYQYNDPTIPI